MLAYLYTPHKGGENHIMRTIASHKKDTCVYPGEYIPLPEQMDKLSVPPFMRKPSANIIESENYYRVQLAIPGHTKEDFVIEVEDQQLLITVSGHVQLQTGSMFHHLHDFGYEHLEERIDLPDDVDTDFSVAEYSSGVLTLYFSKAVTPVLHMHHHIVVY